MAKSCVEKSFNQLAASMNNFLLSNQKITYRIPIYHDNSYINLTKVFNFWNKFETNFH